MYGRAYSEEFKAEALELLESSGKSMRQLERELGIGRGCLARWKGAPGESRIETGGDEQRDPQKVIRDLRRELESVRMERDILKKAVAIFSRTKP